ncbi:hypothetical protein HDV00_007062 [Rhizophlyctis rosea]|nr:hypothetical protein HDV00_007062 [Rhizophlyctis rosea]
MLDPTLKTLATEEELDEFRKQWKAEVSSKKTTQKQPPITTPKSSSAVPISSSSSAPAPPSLEKAVEKLSLANARSPVSAESSSKAVETKPTALSEPTSRNDHLKDLSPALRVYTQAVSDERMGNLAAAVRGYREATRMDPDVDITFRNYQRSLPSDAKEDTHDPYAEFYTYYHYGQHDQHVSALPTDKPVSELIEQIRGADVHFIREVEGKRSFLIDLPHEIVTQILRFVVYPM